MTNAIIAPGDAEGSLTAKDQRSTHPRIIAAEIARELREHPARWMQHDLVRFADGTTSNTPELVGRNDAVSWCLQGHIDRRALGRPTGNVMTAFEALLEGRVISSWNDDRARTVQDIITLCDRVAASSTC
jgi:hypothetical protein